MLGLPTIEGNRTLQTRCRDLVICLAALWTCTCLGIRTGCLFHENALAPFLQEQYAYAEHGFEVPEAASTLGHLAGIYRKIMQLEPNCGVVGEEV